MTSKKLLYTFILIFTISMNVKPQQTQTTSISSPTNNQNPIFWLLQDEEIESPSIFKAQFEDLKKAGFTSLYVYLRGNRYHIFDSEVIKAAKQIGELCIANKIEFHFGFDPRFGATYIIQKTGYGAQFLLTSPEYTNNINAQAENLNSFGEEREGLNEYKVENGKYNLKYNYPNRRDTHILTEVGMWYNPIGVDKVYAYQRKDGKVVSSSIKDITSNHHFFINRSHYYVEVFGNVNLPEGEWFVTAFPRFMTNMYAYDSKEQQQLFEGLILEYKKQNVQMDGMIWDEPGYYLEFGKYVVSEQLYTDFQKKYGYDLKSKLYALTLKLDDASQLKVRNDYFNLLTDYVVGGEKRCRDIAKNLYGKMRMGIHPTWHDIASEDMFHGVGDYWRSLEAVDGGYTDGGVYENYMTDNLEKRFAAVSYMITAKGLARFSESKKAYFNQWGINFGNDVTTYWNDLMAAFSNEWINHCYGPTGLIGGGRPVGPGYPDHESWAILPGLIKKCKEVNTITSYNLPLGESVIIYPNTTFFGTGAVESAWMERRVLELIGSMPAMGLQTDVIGSNLLDEGEAKNGNLVVRGHVYNTVFLPYNKILSVKSINVLQALIAQKGRVYVGGDVPKQDLDGKPIDLKISTSFSLKGDITKTMEEIGLLIVPSSCSQLKGAYLNLIPSDDGKTFYLTVMPITPNTSVGGVVKCMGHKLEVKETNKLAIYQIDKSVKQLIVK